MQTETDEYVDDVEAHEFDCYCDECMENLMLLIRENWRIDNE